VYDRPGHRLTELLTLNRVKRHRDFWALRDISFDVRPGETFCIIGQNGSGKSTLLQLIASILQPTSGKVTVHGRVAALLELGSGFNPEFTGHDNVYLNASILGLTSREIDETYQQIVDFAEIGDFIHQPVKTYSSGMAVRLAFAVAIHVRPDILLVDEALAVGDIYFRQRCLRKVHELRSSGVTVLFVSHSAGDVKAIGDRALWLDAGCVRQLGSCDEVVAAYLAEMTAKDAVFVRQRARAIPAAQHPSGAPEVVTHIPNIGQRHGDGRAEVIGIALYDEALAPLRILQPGARIVVRISVLARSGINLPNVGFMMRNHLGMDFAGTNSLREGYQLPPLPAGRTLTVDFHLDLPQLYPGTFSFSPAIADGTLNEYIMCDWVENAIALQMSPSDGPIYGYLHLPCRVGINERLRPAGEDQSPDA
jgi:ABC-type polysaccharide/polyol phosphate transport system ATPase subunit